MWRVFLCLQRSVTLQESVGVRSGSSSSAIATEIVAGGTQGEAAHVWKKRPKAIREPSTEPAEQTAPEAAPEAAPPVPPAEPVPPALDSIVLPEPGLAEKSAAAWKMQTPTVSAGSHVVMIVSRGPSPLPPSVSVGMPGVSGEKQGDALLQLQEIGLSVEVLHDHHPRMPRGYVVGQYPLPGGSVQHGADAVLVVSSGRAQLPAAAVPLLEIVGLSHTMAADALIAGGLVPRTVYDHDPVVSPGLVLAQIPSEESLGVRLRRRSGSVWIFAVIALVVVAVAAGAVWFLNRPMSIPNVTGLTQAQAQQSVMLAGFSVGSVSASQTLDAAAVGTVVGQWPAPGGTAAHGSSINLVVSGGQLLVPVPNVTAQQSTAAESALQGAGFVPAISRTFSSTVASGVVISQAPASGQRIPPGTKVGITVSMGQQSVPVPGVTGQPTNTAVTTIRGAGLAAASSSVYDTTTPAGQVINQWPAAGTTVAPGVVVGLLISRGVAPTGTPTAAVPTVVGQSTVKATSALSAVKLKTLLVQRYGTGRPKGEVVAQLPSANTILSRKSKVMLFVSNGR